MALENCEQVNTLFIQGQEHIERNLIKKKFVPMNSYYGKIPEGSFPTNSGLTHRGHRLGRQAPPDKQEWRKIEQDVCNTNACDFDPDVIHNGSDTYNWSIVQMDMRTDWICLDSLIFNEFPEEEISHMEGSLQSINRYVHEEFGRTRYTDLSEHKIVGLRAVDADPPNRDCDVSGACDNEAKDFGWQFARFANGEPDPSEVLVAVPSDEAYRVSTLTNDLLEQTVIRLQYEEASYIADDVQLFDLVLPDLRSSIQLARDEDEAGGFYKSQGGYQSGDLDRDLGVQRIVGNFAHRYDSYAMKYALAPSADQPSAVSFDANDPATWLILRRVYPYKQVAAEIGVRHDINEQYLNAPFAISNVFIRDVLRTETLERKDGYGSARRGMASPDAKFMWKNPDWDCNVLRNKGFWLATWRTAAHPRRTELGHSFLHRLNNKLKLEDICCDAAEITNVAPVSPYCCAGIGGDTECAGENRVQGDRPEY